MILVADISERLNALSLGLRERLNAEHPAHVVVKEDSALHREIAKAFDIAADVRQAASLLSIDVPLSIPSGAEYLADYATTIGDTIALPRKMHAPAAAFERLLVEPHEWQHVAQHRHGVNAGWWPKAVSHSVLYLAGVVAHTADGSEYVGKVEADGYAVTETMRMFLTGRVRPLEEITSSLTRHYNLVTGGSTTAAGLLRSHYRALETGDVPNVWAARVAHEYLSEHAADLRGQVSP